MCETSELPAVSLRAPNRHPSFYPQSQRPPRADAKLAVSRIRHNSTQSNRIQQNPTKIRVCARARAREATAFRFLSLDADCPQVAADSTHRSELLPLAVMPIDQTEPGLSNWLHTTLAYATIFLGLERGGSRESGIHSHACGDRPRCSPDLHFAFHGRCALRHLPEAVERARISGRNAQERSRGDERHIGKVFGVDVIGRRLHIGNREDTVIHPPTVRAES